MCIVSKIAMMSVNFPLLLAMCALAPKSSASENKREETHSWSSFFHGSSCPKLMRIGKVVFYLQGRREGRKTTNKLRSAARKWNHHTGSDHNYAHYLSRRWLHSVSQRVSTGVMTFAWAPPLSRIVESRSKKRGRLKNTHTLCFALSFRPVCCVYFGEKATYCAR